MTCFSGLSFRGGVEGAATGRGRLRGPLQSAHPRQGPGGGPQTRQQGGRGKESFPGTCIY